MAINATTATQLAGKSERGNLRALGTLLRALIDNIPLLDLTGLTASATELNTMTGITATTAELNAVADASNRVVPLAITTVLTAALHEGKTIAMSGAGGARTFTLWNPTVGDKIRFAVAEVNTSNYLVKAESGTRTFKGLIVGQSATDSATDAPRTWKTGATDDTITLNGTTTGGVQIGDWIELECIVANIWAVKGMVCQSGTEATMFSDTVA